MAKRERKRKHTSVRMQGRQVELLHRIERGEEDLSEWDLEELMRGYRRASDGSFRGRPPVAVPQALHEELARRVKSKAEATFLAKVEEVQKAWLAIAKGDFDEDEVAKMSVMLKAQIAWIRRALGDEPTRLEISGSMRHEQVFNSVIVNRAEMLEDPEIIDAEIVDDEFEFDDDDD